MHDDARIVTGIEDGSWLSVTGADFGHVEPFEISMKYKSRGTGAVRVSMDSPDGEVLAYIPVENTNDEIEDAFVSLEVRPSGVHDIFFTFVGNDYDVISWRLIK